MGDAKMFTMQEWLNILEFGHKYHICVWSGVAVSQTIGLDFFHRIHRTEICKYIKATPRGLKSCKRCRACADLKAQKTGKFSGLCIHGLYEIAYPVYYGGEYVATVYISNLYKSSPEAEKRLKKTCGYYGFDETDINNMLGSFETEFDEIELFRLCKAVSELICIELHRHPAAADSGIPPLVKILSETAADCESSDTLKSISRRYHVNEKYLGRLFKKHFGCSFSEYRIKSRLNDSRDLLRNSRMKIIDISAAVGFDNVSYFNRRFRTEYGMTPSEYRSISAANEV